MWPDKNGKIIGRLAESREISPDGLTRTFRLIDGVKWHNGEPIKASDVKFTYDYIKEKSPLINNQTPNK